MRMSSLEAGDEGWARRMEDRVDISKVKSDFRSSSLRGSAMVDRRD